MYPLGLYIVFTCFHSVTKSEQRKMDGFVVMGEKAAIEAFPHSAYIGLTCLDQRLITRWRCGASILNQQILLTAAHCFDPCTGSGVAIISIGNANRLRGHTVKVDLYKIHPHYRVNKFESDIALARTWSSLTFSSRVGRVAIMRHPPYQETAYVAGWGLIDEIHQKSTELLHYTKQTVIPGRTCSKAMRSVLPGTFCAKGTGYASRGDSGSALVVRQFIQIGLVSYKNPTKSRDIVVYTDVGFYYDWITKNAEELYCSEK